MKPERFLVKVMRRLFRAVGRTYAREVTATPEWCTTSSWTHEQENCFRDWLPQELVKRCHLPKKRAQFQAAMFLLYYGWVIEDKPKQRVQELARSPRCRRFRNS